MDDEQPNRVPSWHYRLVVAAVVLAAVLTRFAGLDRYPLPIHQDELSNIYDGYSLATTGADRTGARWPFIVRAMGPGDYRPALYPYLAAVTTGLWGFSTWSGRLPAAVLGVLTVVLVYLFARRLGGRTGGLLALLFATFCPILIQYGRQAHEGACLPPFFAILIVYLLYRATSSPAGDAERRGHLSWVAVAGLAVGLSASAYGAQRLTAPLFAVVGGMLILWQVGWRQREAKRAAAAILVFVLATSLAAGPQVYAMVDQPDEFFARAETVGYNWRAGPVWWAERLIEGYAAHFDPRHLILPPGQYVDLAVARLSVVALPFLYLGLGVALYRMVRRQPGYFLLLVAVLICILPAVASKRHCGFLRASGVWSLYPVVCALGVLGLGSAVQTCRRRPMVGRFNRDREGAARRTRPRGILTAVVGVAIVAAGVWNIGAYLARPEWRNPKWCGSAVYQGHLVRIGEWLRERGGDCERIYIDAPGHFAYLYIAAFSGLSPAEFQRAPRQGSVTWDGWEEFDRFGRFRFADLSVAEADWAVSDGDDSWLFVGSGGQTVLFHSALTCCEDLSWSCVAPVGPFFRLPVASRDSSSSAWPVPGRGVGR